MTFARSDVQIMIENSLDRLFSEEHDFERRQACLAPPTPDRLALWPALTELGVIGTALPEELGGFGGEMRDIAVVMAAIGRSLAVEPYLETAICARLMRAAPQEAIAELASELLSGERLLSLIYGTAFDPFAIPQLTTIAAGSNWLVSGEAPIVRHGDLADDFLVAAALPDAGDIGCFLLNAKADGISIEPFRMMDASSAARIVFRNSPARLLLTGEALSTALRDAVELGIVGLAAEATAIIRALNAATFEYLGTRRQFGVPLASFQALQHRAANMHIAAEETEIFTERAIDSMDAPPSDARSSLISALKALIDDAGRKVGHEAVQLHGGMGVSDELNVSHYMRRLATIRAQLGGADFHRDRFFRHSY